MEGHTLCWHVNFLVTEQVPYETNLSWVAELVIVTTSFTIDWRASMSDIIPSRISSSESGSGLRSPRETVRDPRIE